MTVGEEEVTLKQNEDLKLTCDVEGYPIPEVKWYINNTPLKKDNRIQIYDNHTLFLEQAKLIDEGIYTCRYMYSLLLDSSNSNANLICTILIQITF